MLLRSIARWAPLVVGLVAGIAPAAAQQVPEPPPAADAAAPTIDVTRLGLDLARINRQLRQAAAREQRDGLNLRYIIDVYGRAPRIDVLDPKRDNLVYGPVPYGAPTHQQMLDVMTPQEFRAPVADFSSIIRWLSDKSKNK
jgi:hypothetical protein